MNRRTRDEIADGQGTPWNYSKEDTRSPSRGCSTIELLPRLMEQVGLERLIDDLDKVDNWSERLSLGEQQGLAFARILLSKPALLFLDEATSALDDDAKSRLFGLLRSGSWQPTIVSVGHGEIDRKLHPTCIDLTTFRPHQPVAAKR